MSDNGELKRLGYLFDKQHRQIIGRAIMLKHGIEGMLDESDSTTDGSALGDIAAEWLDIQSKRIAEGGNS